MTTPIELTPIQGAQQPCARSYVDASALAGSLLLSIFVGEGAQAGMYVALPPSSARKLAIELLAGAEQVEQNGGRA